MNNDTEALALGDLFGLSDAAKQAVSWLHSEQARNLSVMEARAAILEGFGVAVNKELGSIFFCKMDEDGPLRCLVCGGLEPCSHSFDAITWPNAADVGRAEDAGPAPAKSTTNH